MSLSRVMLPFLIMLATAAGLTVAGRVEERSPIPLYTPPLATPVETAGTGLAPEVQVRIQIDAANVACMPHEIHL